MVNIRNISDIKSNPKNPRVIRDDKFAKLVQSLKDFPEMLEKRPLVCFTDTDNKLVVLGGNMRLKAAKEIGLKKLPVLLADDWNEEQKAQFLIKDNVGFGEWDWEVLANEWDTKLLDDWAVNLPAIHNDVDYSVLDMEDVSKELSEMSSGVKKAILIEFELEHYEEALKVIKYWRDAELYIGGFLIEKLKLEQTKNK